MQSFNRAGYDGLDMNAGLLGAKFRAGVPAPTRVRETPNMATNASAAHQGAANDRRIETGRLTKALTEPMDIAPHAPDMYAVTNANDVSRVVDVREGSCQCKDHEYRGDEYVCKHLCRAAITHAFRSERNTRLVARVLARVKETGCVHDVRGCDGPTQIGARGIPCEECIAATPGHWTVYCRLTGHGEWLDTGVDRGAGIATDGGQPADDEYPTDTALDDEWLIDARASPEDLPPIETIRRTANDTPLRGQCTDCGSTGPYDLDGEAVILHEHDCPHAEDGDR